MTQRIIPLPETGPLVADVHLSTGTVQVRVLDDPAALPVVRISTPAVIGPAAEAVEAATVTEHGGRLRVYVPTPTTAITSVGPAAFHTSTDTFTFTAPVVIGSVAFSNGAVVIGAGTTGVTAMPWADEITVDLALPAGSGLNATTVSAMVTSAGPLATAEVTTVSGSIHIGACTTARLQSTSGPIEVDALAGDAVLTTVSGPITAHTLGPIRVTARSASGDIHITGSNPRVEARSLTGRVTTGPRYGSTP